MKYIKGYNESLESNQDIHDICNKYGIENYTINDDDSIDVKGDVIFNSGSFFYHRLTEMPLKFRNVSGDFICSKTKITTFKGFPEYVGGSLHCRDNNIKSFEGFPEDINKYFFCLNNPIYHIWELFEDESKIELFNDYGIIRDDSILLDRLNDFLLEIGKEPVKEVKGWKCI